MSIKSLMATACGALLAVSAMSALAQDSQTKGGRKSCCTSACRHASGKMKCSLTGKTMDTCCCVQKEGKLHCTLADKDVDSCCCQPVDESGHGGDHDHDGAPDEPQE